MPRHTQQTKNQLVRGKRIGFLSDRTGRKEQRRRDEWLQLHVGLWIKRPRGHVVYQVVGPDQVQMPGYRMDVVRLRREDDTELTVGYREAMEMVTVR